MKNDRSRDDANPLAIRVASRPTDRIDDNTR